MSERLRRQGNSCPHNCVHCGRAIPFPGSCRSRICQHFGPIWAGDQRRKIFVNLGEYDRQYKNARVRLGAVTAPGVDVLPWDEEWCAYRGPHKHSGPDGCRVDPVLGKAWNATFPERWRRLQQAAAQAAARETGIYPTLILRAHEMQPRQALHAHPVTGYTTPSERRAANAYFRHLDRLASSHGFGYTERKSKVMEAMAAAAYLSSYFVKGSKKKATLQESVRHPQMPRSIIYVSRRLTQATGCTMRTLRWRRYFYMRSRLVLDFDELRRFIEERERERELIRTLSGRAAANAPPTCS